MKTLNFGVEIEMKDMDVYQGVNILSEFFGNRPIDLGGYLSAHGVYDCRIPTRRLWKMVTDSSIGSNGCEFVTPILEYSDIETLQKIVRKFRENGARIDGTCGIHVHVNLKGVKTRNVFNLVNLFYEYEDLIFESCHVKHRRICYCEKTNADFITCLNAEVPHTKDAFKRIWYATQPDYRCSTDAHYHLSRYHALNLHSWFQYGTVEFRLFNSTLHAGRVKAYVQFALALVAKVKEMQGYISRTKLSCDTPADKLNEFKNFLQRDLKLDNDEFKTCRFHLLKHLRENVIG